MSEWISDVTTGVWLLYAFGHAGSVKTKRNRGVEGVRISVSFIIYVRIKRTRMLFVIFVRAYNTNFVSTRARREIVAHVRISSPKSFHLCALR